MNGGPIIITPDSAVTMHLRLSLSDGTVALSTFGDEPLAFQMGDGTLEKGLELALYGLEIGAHERVTLRPGQAYGLRDPEQVHTMALTDFPDPAALEAGQIIAFAVPNGDSLPGTLLSIDADQVRVDFNHPLAGREILLEAEILDIRPHCDGPSHAD
jgi:FKBP-type peptidyl-prolyl cis-trans isomerase SlpA